MEIELQCYRVACLSTCLFVLIIKYPNLPYIRDIRVTYPGNTVGEAGIFLEQDTRKSKGTMHTHSHTHSLIEAMLRSQSSNRHGNQRTRSNRSQFTCIVWIKVWPEILSLAKYILMIGQGSTTQSFFENSVLACLVYSNFKVEIEKVSIFKNLFLERSKMICHHKNKKF